MFQGFFGITAGSFDETGEDLELEKPDGRARIFVIAGGGLGRKSFRSLQRKGIPFATGIIYENDLDYPAAKALSAEIVSARSFEPVDDALIEKAKELIDACEGVYVTEQSLAHMSSLTADFMSMQSLQEKL